jgi:hypothetical protein
MVVNIFAEIQQNGHPNIIRSDFHIPVIDVCLKKSSEKPIFIFFRQWTALFIAIDLFHEIFLP